MTFGMPNFALHPVSHSSPYLAHGAQGKDTSSTASGADLVKHTPSSDTGRLNKIRNLFSVKNLRHRSQRGHRSQKSRPSSAPSRVNTSQFSESIQPSSLSRGLSSKDCCDICLSMSCKDAESSSKDEDLSSIRRSDRMFLSSGQFNETTACGSSANHIDTHNTQSKPAFHERYLRFPPNEQDLGDAWRRYSEFENQRQTGAHSGPRRSSLKRKDYNSSLIKKVRHEYPVRIDGLVEQKIFRPEFAINGSEAGPAPTIKKSELQIESRDMRRTMRWHAMLTGEALEREKENRAEDWEFIERRTTQYLQDKDEFDQERRGEGAAAEERGGRTVAQYLQDKHQEKWNEYDKYASIWTEMHPCDSLDSHEREWRNMAKFAHRQKRQMGVLEFQRQENLHRRASAPVTGYAKQNIDNVRRIAEYERRDRARQALLKKEKALQLEQCPNEREDAEEKTSRWSRISLKRKGSAKSGDQCSLEKEDVEEKTPRWRRSTKLKNVDQPSSAKKDGEEKGTGWTRVVWSKKDQLKRPEQSPSSQSSLEHSSSEESSSKQPSSETEHSRDDGVAKTVPTASIKEATQVITPVSSKKKTKRAMPEPLWNMMLVAG